MAVVIAIGALILAACDPPPYGAHMLSGHNHVGYPPGSILPIRDAEWFDETGQAAWVAAEQKVHDNWQGVVTLNNAAGHHLPLLAFYTSGGHAGCGNEPGGLDVCVENLPRNNGDGTITIALAHITVDAQKHITNSHIGVPPASYPLSASSRIAFMCQEVGHELGLDHNTSNPGSCMKAINPVGETLGNDDITELNKMYDGHTE